MPEYRAYIIGPDGHFLIEAADDTAAVTAAKPLVDGHDVEVWLLDRKVAILPHTSE